MYRPIVAEPVAQVVQQQVGVRPDELVTQLVEDGVAPRFVRRHVTCGATGFVKALLACEHLRLGVSTTGGHREQARVGNEASHDVGLDLGLAAANVGANVLLGLTLAYGGVLFARAVL